MDLQKAYDIPIYSAAARKYHWFIAGLLVVQIPIGLYMVYRGNDMVTVNAQGESVKGVWDGMTNTLYSSHKLIGLLILLLVILRLGYRLTQGTPPIDQTVPPALTGISHLLHWSLYILLIAVPIFGYLAISYGNYLDVFSFRLPGITPEDKDMSKEIFEWHETGAEILAIVAAIHVIGAFYHKFIRRDRLVERMLPKKSNVI
jgi:cytochrome b561